MAFKLAFYADDFTGATDTLATLAHGGQRAMLFLCVPSEQELAHAGPLDCVGIAGAARSMQNQDQTAELEAVATYLKSTGAPVIHYKTCSTFDSSTQVGSIGLAVRVLRKNLKTGGFTPIVGGQPNLGRYCVFSNLFAAFQTGAEAFRIDRHPTMSRHPVTPMGEADLRHHLAEQGLTEISAIQYPSYEKSDEALDEEVDAAITQGSDGVLFDVACPAHLPVIGRQIWQRAGRGQTLAVGPSSVAQALLAHWQATASEGAASFSSEEGGQLLGSSCANALSLRTASDQNQTAQGAETAGPVLVLSGSMSPLTARQIEVATSYLHIPLSVADLLDAGSQARAIIVKRIKQGLQAGRNVLAHLVHSEHAALTEQAIDPVTLARASGSLLAEVLQMERPARLGLAGGDTSSLAILSLDVWGLTYIGQIDPGVALCRLHSNQASLDGLDVMLKGGQMGSLDVFEKLAKKADWRHVDPDTS